MLALAALTLFCKLMMLALANEILILAAAILLCKLSMFRLATVVLALMLVMVGSTGK